MKFFLSAIAGPSQSGSGHSVAQDFSVTGNFSVRTIPAVVVCVGYQLDEWA